MVARETPSGESTGRALLNRLHKDLNEGATVPHSNAYLSWSPVQRFAVKSLQQPPAFRPGVTCHKPRGKVSASRNESLGDALRTTYVPYSCVIRTWSGSRLSSSIAWQCAVRHASYAQTARDSAIVINATPANTSLDWFVPLQSELDGKILVDVANATISDEDGMPGALCYPSTSLAEHLQRALPARAW